MEKDKRPAVVRSKGSGKYLPKVYDLEGVNMDGSVIARDTKDLPYKLVLASALIDVWAFGMLLLDLLVEGQGLIAQAAKAHGGLDKNIAFWKEEELNLYIFNKVREKDPVLADLLSKLLQPDPSMVVLSFALRISLSLSLTHTHTYTCTHTHKYHLASSLYESHSRAPFFRHDDNPERSGWSGKQRQHSEQ